MQIHTVLILNQSESVSCSISQVTKSKKSTSQECLPRIRVIFFVQYYDPESKRVRQYYPDFLALMEDGTYQLIEVKGDNMIDDAVVRAKKPQPRKCLWQAVCVT